MASFRKRGESWQARVKRFGYPDQVKTFPSKSSAEQWARSVESSFDQGSFTDGKQLKRILFRDIIIRYIESVCPSHRGGTAETIRLRALLRRPLASVSLSNLSPAIIADYRDQRLRLCSSSTVVRELAMLSAIINHARREWSITMQNPVSLVRKPAMPEGRSRILNSDEEIRLMHEIEPRGRRNPLMKPIVVFALETAMRLNEIIMLEWRNVDFKSRTALLPMTKNGLSRTVPLSTTAIKTLADLERTSGKVFPIKAAALQRAFLMALRRARIDDFHFHDLRHTATTRMAQKLPNVIELAAVTGHRSLHMLKRYYHPRASELAEKLG